jgi:hypothetical protein
MRGVKMVKDEILKRTWIGVPESSSGQAGTWFRVTDKRKDWEKINPP